MMGHHGAFLGKALDMFGLLFQITLRDEKRKIGIFHAGGLEHAVHPR
jgi:hypothetical protein